MAARASMPLNRIGAALAWWMLSTARIIALEGTQPTLTHVPPMVPAPMTATSAPCSTAVMAAENPADPPPMTTRSYFLSGARPAGSPPLFMMRRSLANLLGVASVGGRRAPRLGAGLGVVIEIGRAHV